MQKFQTSILLLSGLAVLSAVAQPSAQPLPPHFSAFAEMAEKLPPIPLIAAPAGAAPSGGAPVLHSEPSLGVPTFLWVDDVAAARGPVSAAPADPENAARRSLQRYAERFRLNQQGLDSARLDHVHVVGGQVAIVRFNQQVNGVDVFQRKLNVLLDAARQAVAISGYLSPHADRAEQASAAFQLNMPQAIAAAFADRHHASLLAGQLHLEKQRGAYRWYGLHAPRPEAGTLKPVRIKPVYFELPDRLEPAYYLELNSSDGDGRASGYAYVVSAQDGAVLYRDNLTHADSAVPYTYRVWAENSALPLPYDSPYGNRLTPYPGDEQAQRAAPLPANLITLACGPISTCDPWLPLTAVQTVGNNVDAYADVTRPDGYNQGDLRAALTAPFTFDPHYDFARFDKKDPAQLAPAIVQAFYTANFMHDWLYDHGFDEQAGNAQDQNFGRGGEEVDRMRVEVSDNSGIDNADMNVPADGESPTMQMYPWSHNVRQLTVVDVDVNEHPYEVAAADFGPKSAEVTAAIAIADDGNGTRWDACETPLLNAVAMQGRIALIQRGTCKFAEKIKNAQDAGALGVVIVNNVAGPVTNMGSSGDLSLDRSILIPALMVGKTDGAAIKRAVAAAGHAGQAGLATLKLEDLPPFSGALDSTIVIHEWGHFLSLRLTALGNNQGSEMGEGWSDFLALLAMSQASDRKRTGNDLFQGTYAVGIYAGANDPKSGYFGIRRYPYSTDLSKNPLTFKHIQNGVALPAGIPVAYGADGADNAELHNAGEVWGAMLWEAYVALLNDTGRLTFEQARDRMLDYLVASLKLTPTDPTFLEARDALLAVAKARDLADYQAIWGAFAKRGAGVNAKAPRRYSIDNQGVVEDYSTP